MKNTLRKLESEVNRFGGCRKEVFRSTRFPVSVLSFRVPVIVRSAPLAPGHFGHILPLRRPEEKLDMAVDVTIEKDCGFAKTSDYCWVNIVVNGARVGKARVHASGTQAVVYSINVFPEFQGNGYGRGVICSLQRHYKEITADRVRDAATGFWAKMGFRTAANGNYVWRSSYNDWPAPDFCANLNESQANV